MLHPPLGWTPPVKAIWNRTRQEQPRLRRLCQPDLFRSPQGVVLFGNWESGMRKRVPDQPVRVEIHFPVMLVVAVRANRKQRARKVEYQDLDIGCRLGHHVRHLRQHWFQLRNPCLRVHTVRQLCRQFDTLQASRLPDASASSRCSQSYKRAVFWVVTVPGGVAG